MARTQERKKTATKKSVVRKTTSKPRARKPAKKSPKPKASIAKRDERQEFPVSTEVLRRMYVAVRETRDYARAYKKLSPISEATTVAAAVGLSKGDVLAVPADGKTIYPVAEKKGPEIAAATPENVAKIGARLARRGKRGVAVVVIQQKDFSKPAWQAVYHRTATMPVIYVLVTDVWRTVDATIPEIDVDGQDPVAVFRVVGEAMRRARNGRGASLVRCQGAAQTRASAASDTPMLRLTNYLDQKGLFTEEFRTSLE